MYLPTTTGQSTLLLDKFHLAVPTALIPKYTSIGRKQLKNISTEFDQCGKSKFDTICKP